MSNEIIKFVNGDLQIDVTVSPNEEGLTDTLVTS